MVALQHKLAGKVLAALLCVLDHMRQRRHIAQPRIEPLPRNRMHPVRRIANKHKSLFYKGIRNGQLERIGKALAVQFDLPEEVPKARAQHFKIV